MSMLLFHVGENRYVIENRYILRIIPRVLLKKIPYAPSYIPGLLNFGGKPVPVVDFCLLVEQRETRFCMNSRIILMQDPTDESQARTIGLLGEEILEIVDLKRTQFENVEFNRQHFPYLDRVFSDQQGVIQYLNIEEFFHFLSKDLFQAAGKDHHGF